MTAGGRVAGAQHVEAREPRQRISRHTSVGRVAARTRIAPSPSPASPTISNPGSASNSRRSFCRASGSSSTMTTEIAPHARESTDSQGSVTVTANLVPVATTTLARSGVERRRRSQAVAGRAAIPAGAAPAAIVFVTEA